VPEKFFINNGPNNAHVRENGTSSPTARVTRPRGGAAPRGGRGPMARNNADVNSPHSNHSGESTSPSSTQQSPTGALDDFPMKAKEPRLSHNARKKAAEAKKQQDGVGSPVNREHSPPPSSIPIVTSSASASTDSSSPSSETSAPSETAHVTDDATVETSTISPSEETKEVPVVDSAMFPSLSSEESVQRPYAGGGAQWAKLIGTRHGTDSAPVVVKAPVVAQPKDAHATVVVAKSLRPPRRRSKSPQGRSRSPARA